MDEREQIDERERRFGLNEALFREVNERLRGLNEAFGEVTNRMELVCECANPGCAERISMTVRQYEELRSEPEHFVIAPGHAAPDIEEVIATGEGWEIVRKREGGPAELARASDPRS
jgi:hypothetical protein